MCSAEVPPEGIFQGIQFSEEDESARQLMDDLSILEVQYMCATYSTYLKYAYLQCILCVLCVLYILRVLCVLYVLCILYVLCVLYVLCILYVQYYMFIHIVFCNRIHKKLSQVYSREKKKYLLPKEQFLV